MLLKMLEHIWNAGNYFCQVKLLVLCQRDRDCLPTDFKEMHAFLGVLYLTGVKKHLNTTSYGLHKEEPVQAIQFDYRGSRKEMLKEDNLAPVRYIFEHFVEKCVQQKETGVIL